MSTRENQNDPLKLSDIPKGTILNQGLDDNGFLRLPWNLSVDGVNLLPPPAIVALALNEAGRAIGAGLCVYIPALPPFAPLCVPEVYFSGYVWSEEDKVAWDTASYSKRLRLVSQVNRYELAIPLRVLTFRVPQDYISFPPEEARLSGAIVTYDGRPYVGWYRDYASRRNDDRMNISIDLVQHEAWFESMRCRDNYAVVERLLRMWTQPIPWGIQVIGDVVEKMANVRTRREQIVPDPAMVGYQDYEVGVGVNIADYEADDDGMHLCSATEVEDCCGPDSDEEEY
ncbi:hypothetical protein AJ79_05160 [Helicocarpus griseus UAMH5409]|uniref:Uncharacterized protein n=1 Tax=Helicocarpus griseus UAMH5409 TaxID=1447875 RepID=A0A2B7XPW2_9EURO|nr:hypothetical protein AJ79_05160 [Helicocarpus griseus UAMH5409]